jgi:hypothetical protein
MLMLTQARASGVGLHPDLPSAPAPLGRLVSAPLPIQERVSYSSRHLWYGLIISKSDLPLIAHRLVDGYILAVRLFPALPLELEPAGSPSPEL